MIILLGRKVPDSIILLYLPLKELLQGERKIQLNYISAQNSCLNYPCYEDTKNGLIRG